MRDFTQGGYTGPGKPDDRASSESLPQGTAAPDEKILSDSEAGALVMPLIRIGPDDV